MKWFFISVALAGAVAVSATAAELQEVRLTIREHRFDPAEIRVKAGHGVKLLILNADPAAEEFESPSLRKEKKILAGQTVEMSFPHLALGTYEFYGEFHPDSAKGKLVVEP